MAQQPFNVGTDTNNGGIIRLAAFKKLRANVTDAESRFQALEAGASVFDWGFFVTNAKYAAVDTVVASGIVRDYTLGGNTIYRLVTTAFGPIYPIEDSFYDDFDGVNLTNLLATRG